MWGLTEPMERKKPNVAALLSMYCERVGSAPRGPAPPLSVHTAVNVRCCASHWF